MAGITTQNTGYFGSNILKLGFKESTKQLAIIPGRSRHISGGQVNVVDILQFFMSLFEVSIFLR